MGDIFNVSWIEDNIRTVGLLVIAGIGVLIIIGSRRQRWGEVLNILGFVLIGASLIVGGYWWFNAAQDAGDAVFNGMGATQSVDG